MMRLLLDPNDWFARRPSVCLAIIGGLILVVGVI